MGDSWSRNRQLLGLLARGWASGLRRRRAELRHHVVRDAWTITKRFGAPRVINIERHELACVAATEPLTGPADDPQRLLLAALARGLGAGTFFEIGTNRGQTTWTVAHNNPELRAYTLDVPPGFDMEGAELPLGSDDRHFLLRSCGEAFAGTPEAGRITQLLGDSATFDYAPYRGRMDLVYIDGAHTYEYVRSDSANALAMLTAGGTIAWDDYTSNPGVWRAVNELAAELPQPVFHVFGTRMALFSRRDDIVARRPLDSHTSVPAV